MGCCQGSRIPHEQEKDFCQKLKESIEDNSIKRVSILLSFSLKTSKKKEPLFIDKVITVDDNISFNALGYSAYLGNDSVFNYLIENGASFKVMEDLFLSQRFKLINLLCSKGHIDILKIYLPLYLEYYHSPELPAYNPKIELLGKQTSQILPIHAACKTGMAIVVLYLHNFFKNYASVPNEFSIFSKDECTGEDCSLIACRSGYYLLVKILHDLGMNFKTLNKNKENAIMICVQGDRMNPDYSYLEILTHLVEVVGLDISYRYEEVLIMASSDFIIDYIEKQLTKKDIFVKKERGKIYKELSISCEFAEYEKVEDEKPFKTDSFLSSICQECEAKETPMSFFAAT